MSNEKAEALLQIKEIKNHLVDKQTFYPYNYHATYVWSIIAFILTVSIIPLFEQAVWMGMLVPFGLLSIGFMIEGFLTKKVNQSYDIEDCTLRQKFIFKYFLLAGLFLLLSSTILASYHLFSVMYLLWLFIISVGHYMVGFVLNIKRFSQLASFNMLAASLLLLLGSMNHTLQGKTDIYLNVVQIFLVLGLTVMPAIVAWQQIREGK